MHKLIYIFIIISFAFSFEIDINNLESNLDKYDIKNRLLISKYYLDKNNLNKSKKYVLEILKIDPKNKKAKSFLRIINLKDNFFKYLKNNNISLKKIDKFYKNLYLNKKYKEIINNAKYMRFLKNDYPKLVTAKILMLNGEYQKSEDILKLVKNKTFDYIEIKAYNCYYLKKYKCAKDNFSKLYLATYKLKYAYKLIDTYFFLNDIIKADYLISKLIKAYPNSTKLKKYKEKVLKLKKAQLTKLRKLYEEKKNFANLQKIVTILLKSKRENEAYRLLNEYIKTHPDDDNAKYWYATYLSWHNHNNEALYILNSIEDDKNYKTKLLKAKIFSWSKEYEKAINYLNDIIVNSNNKKLIIDAKELKGFIYYWKQDYKKAKTIFKEVLKHKTSIEIEEALMNIEGNVQPLIKKYIHLYNHEKDNLEYILKIAQFSEKIKDIDTALKFYEKAYAIKPNIEVAHSLARLYLLKNNPYKAFSYYEYWAYKVNSKKSLLELAKAYYYAGYTKSALEVIDEILKRYPNLKEAIDLKAKILKFEPKFIQNSSKLTIADILSNKAKQILNLANRLYFNGHYEEAIDYFKEYLLENTEDYRVRERYAYALQFTGKYKKAKGEFFLLTLVKKDCNTFYHYALNLEKSGKKKEAEKIYQKAKEYAIKPLYVNPKLKKFIDDWKKAKETLNINKFKKFYAKKIRNNKIWLFKTKKLFKNVTFISLYLSGKSIISERKYKTFTIYTVKVYEQCTTNKKTTKGYRTFKIKCDKNGCLIYEEKFEKGKFVLPKYVCYNNIMKPKSIRTISMAQLLKNLKNGKYDISLDKALKKDIREEKEVLAIFDVNVSKKFELPKKKNNNIIQENINEKKHKFGILGYYYYKENNNLALLEYGTYYKDNFIYADFQKWRLYNDNKERKGKFITLKLKKNTFSFGAEMGKYENSSYVYPSLEYKNYFNYKVYQSVFGRDNKSFCAVDKNLSSLNFSISKYKSANIESKKDIPDYWAEVKVSKVNDKNIIVTPQFEYRINKNSTSYQDDNVNVYYYLSGWYLFNSKENSCYYSPKAYDSTFIELHPIYKNLELIGKIGYSFIENASLYGYGFEFQYNDYLKLKCMKNYSYRKNNPNFSYFECYLDAGVIW